MLAPSWHRQGVPTVIVRNKVDTLVAEGGLAERSAAELRRQVNEFFRESILSAMVTGFLVGLWALSLLSLVPHFEVDPLFVYRSVCFVGGLKVLVMSKTFVRATPRPP